MIYQKKIDTVKETLSADPKWTNFRLTKGLIYQFEVYFPPGSCGNLKVQVFEKETQMYPSTDGELFEGDNICISFQETCIVSLVPYVWRIKTINEDPLFDHSCIIRIGLISQDDLMLRYIPESSIQVLEKLVEVYAEKTSDRQQSSRKFIKEVLGLYG